MEVFTIIAVLVFISAAFAYINEKFLKLPGTIGVMAIAIMVSVLLLTIGKTHTATADALTQFAKDFDFSVVMLNVMLGFLLFAGALHFDYEKLKGQRNTVLIMSTLGVVISTTIFGLLLYTATHLFSIEIPLVYCLLFGALISPTDPIAVAAILKKSRIPPRLQTIIAGESLFNDGIGLVLFVVLLNITDPSTANYSAGKIAGIFLQEVFGGVALGLIVGFAGYYLIKSIRDFQTIFLISLSVVLILSVVAPTLHVSGPLAVVSAGLVIGNQSFSKDHPAYRSLHRIWQLLDEVLNTILFVMIGLQLMLMPFLSTYWLTGLLSVILLLISRLCSITLPAIVLLKKTSFGNLTILTWAGLRGGISVAMALLLPDSPYREIIVSSCYFIVIFSIIVQGLTLNKVVNLFVKK